MPNMILSQSDLPVTKCYDDRRKPRTGFYMTSSGVYVNVRAQHHISDELLQTAPSACELRPMLSGRTVGEAKLFAAGEAFLKAASRHFKT